MKAMMKLFGAAILAAAVTLATASCQKENQNDNITPSEQAVSGIHVSVNAGIVETKSAVVTESGVRTLTFTTGDKLNVRASLTLDLGEGDVYCTLSGELDVATIGNPATSATFEGDLTLYKGYDVVSYNFGTNNPLDLCTSARASLIHEGTSASFTPGMGYFEQVASSVDELMTNCLNVSGDYDTQSHSFSLSAGGTSGMVLPIFNCTITGLAPSTPYEIYLLIGDNADNASGDMALGGMTSNGMGQLTFACYSSIYSSQAYYYAFRFKNGNDWMRAELGSKQLESKVYNISRAASADPASPVKPTVTGTTGTWNSDLSVYYHDVADITISGTSKGYYFNLYAGGTVRMDNLSASYHVNPFIHSRAGLNIELTGDNSIISKSRDCIEVLSDVFGNDKHDVRLSCTGSRATLSLTYDGRGVWGITADNYEHEPLDGSYNPELVSNLPVPELAETGYSVELTTVQNSDGTWTSTYTVTLTGLLAGQFTINAGGDKVRFSQGNLRYLSVDNGHNGTGTWSFAPTQYSIIGNSENNAHPTAPTTGNSMDLFCWGATGIPNMEDLTNPTPNPDGIVDNETPGLYYYTGNSTLSGIYEWGNVSISNTSLTNWRTLTKDEWEYLFSNNAKYGPATVAGRVGIVLLPDSFSDPNKNGGSAAFVSVSQKTGATYNDNVYSAENWKAMEYAGAVFLPAGGIYYEGTFGYLSSDMGYYWSSTPNTNGNTKAYYFAFLHNVCEVRSGDTNSGDSGVYRSSRLSVRLVRTAN